MEEEDLDHQKRNKHQYVRSVPAVDVDQKTTCRIERSTGIVEAGERGSTSKGHVMGLGTQAS